ncbi:MAG: Hsp20/alpha crystallin family protein [Erysipelotrichaceae bacterium]|nr:Hsp20/alpha crystallin family protein [Erysipelotrichaceae bacterium]MCI9525264.1 Hsp20/alpha crystallin family protein [Erysipelotrichaceae bacterium]
MRMPSIFSDNFIDDFFDFDPFRGLRSMDSGSLMKTDIKEHANVYILEVSLPGYHKEDIMLELKDGYLTVSVNADKNNDQVDEKTGKYIRRERYYGSASRSFYVGKDMQQEEIRAKYENGLLYIAVPKKESSRQEIDQKRYIPIEGR